jgi:transposase-like protein
MNPQPLFCPNDACASRGCTQQANIVVHDSLKNRYRCKTCGKTFTATKGTTFYRLKTAEATVVLVVTLLANGCPLQAIVVAFGFDERTVKTWQNKAGQHCQKVHEHLVEQPQDLRQVQADEMRVRLQQRAVVWLAMALCVPTRLWLGGVVSPHRDTRLLVLLATKVKACAIQGPLVLVSDGWKAYLSAWQKVFRHPHKTGKRGRPPLVAWPEVALAQIVKWREAGRVLGIRECRLAGCWQQIACLLPTEQVLNTAYIERLNATFRQKLACLVRRSRALARQEPTLTGAMYLLGSVYNFCTYHQSLEQDGTARTPAMAAGLTDYCWSVGELLSYRIAPAPFVPNKRRGRKPKSQASLTKGAERLVTL